MRGETIKPGAGIDLEFETDGKKHNILKSSIAGTILSLENILHNVVLDKFKSMMPAIKFSPITSKIN